MTLPNHTLNCVDHKHGPDRKLDHITVEMERPTYNGRAIPEVTHASWPLLWALSRCSLQQRNHPIEVLNGGPTTV